MKEEAEQLPRKVHLQDIIDKIVSTEYIRMTDGRTTVCNVTMRNGFTVRGESSCVDAREFNQALGEKYAFEQAIDKIWAFEGYLLRERHYQAGM